MCLAIPMKVLEVRGNEAFVETSGLRRKIGLHLVKNVRPGDYVIVHAGFAIEKLNEKSARETLDIIRKIGRPACHTLPRKAGRPACHTLPRKAGKP